MAKKRNYKNKSVGDLIPGSAFTGVRTKAKDITMGFNLGHSPKRWAFGIGLGLVFLASIFIPLIFYGMAPVGAVFFWIALWYGWPKNATSMLQIYSYIFLQILIGAAFIGFFEWGAPIVYKALGRDWFKLIFLIFTLPLWLGLSRLIFGWIEKSHF